MLECHTLDILVSEAPPITNLSDLNIDQRFTVYPNPTSGNLNLVFTYIDQTTKILIKDYLGRLVNYIDVFPSTEISHYSIDLSNLSVGTYFVHLISSESHVVPIQISR